MMPRSSAPRTADTTLRSVNRATPAYTLADRYSERHVDGPVGSERSSSKSATANKEP